MNVRGWTLIELMVGLAVGAMVSAIAMTALTMAALSVRRQRAETVDGDTARMALTAMARDLAANLAWHVCSGKRACEGGINRDLPGVPVVMAGRVAWQVDGGLQRCVQRSPAATATMGTATCDEYVEGIVALDAQVDTRESDGQVRRTRLADAVDIRADCMTAIHVTLWTASGRRHERSIARLSPPCV